MARARWVLTGPHYADGWYVIENRNAVMPEFTQTWFRTRAPARAFHRALRCGAIRWAEKIRRQYA